MESSIDKCKRVENTFFPNGGKYLSKIFEKDHLVELQRFFTNGTIAQNTTYKNDKVESKIFYDRNGNEYECFYFDYDDNDFLERISKHHSNTRSEVAFLYDDGGKIVKIRIKHNNIIIRMLDYYWYDDNSILCDDKSEERTTHYKCVTPPKADEKWLAQVSPNSLVMRKLKNAFAIT